MLIKGFSRSQVLDSLIDKKHCLFACRCVLCDVITCSCGCLRHFKEDHELEDVNEIIELII